RAGPETEAQTRRLAGHRPRRFAPIAEQVVVEPNQLGNALLAVIVLDVDDALVAGFWLPPPERTVLTNCDGAGDFLDHGCPSPSSASRPSARYGTHTDT